MSTTELKIRTIINANEPSFSSPYDSDNYSSLLFKDYFWIPSHLKLLIKHGIDINTTDKYGKNASFYCNNLQSLKILLDYGLNLYQLDSYGRTPLFYLRNKNIINEFLKRDINLNTIDNEGLNFLSYCNLYFSDEFILRKTEYIQEKNFIIKHFYSSLPRVLKKSKKYGLTGRLSGEVTLEFNPYTNPEKIKKLLNLIKLNYIQHDFDTTFLVHRYLLCSAEKNEIFTLHDFKNIF